MVMTKLPAWKKRIVKSTGRNTTVPAVSTNLTINLNTGIVLFKFSIKHVIDIYTNQQK